MAEIRGRMTKEALGHFGRLMFAAGLNSVKATVNRQPSIVTANGWDLVTSDDKDFYVKARAIVDSFQDEEAKATRLASPEIQALIDAAEWEDWGETYSSWGNEPPRRSERQLQNLRNS